MRIAFDLDGTLIPTTGSFAVEPPSNWALGVLAKERLRQGAGALLRDLQAAGHELWVYTTSLRSRRGIRFLFWSYGVRLSGVVTQPAHDKVVSNVDGYRPSKYPPAFGIDLLVDDSAGVHLEGITHGFRVLQVEPSDANWANGVRAVVGASS